MTVQTLLLFLTGESMRLHISVFVDIYCYITSPLFIFTSEPGLAVVRGNQNLVIRCQQSEGLRTKRAKGKRRSVPQINQSGRE